MVMLLWVCLLLLATEALFLLALLLVVLWAVPSLDEWDQTYGR